MGRYLYKGAALAIAAGVVALHEGYKEETYLDPIGIPTICYGSTSGIKLGMKKTKGDCEALLKKDLEKAVDAVDRLVKVPITEYEWAAYTSFVYNVGEGRFANTPSVLGRLNKGDRKGACEGLLKYVYAGGIKLKGLVRRRGEESKLCLKGLEL